MAAGVGTRPGQGKTDAITEAVLNALS